MLRPGGNGGAGEKWLDHGCVVKLESIGFAHALDKGYEKNTGVRLTTRHFGLSTLEEEMGETVGKAGLGGKVNIHVGTY